MSKPEEILKKYWGFSAFRPLQKEVIEHVLAGKDSIALLPTGGGKSLCFQVPALIEEGLCIVVSPLVALIEDQVNALKEKGIKAMAITGGISFAEVDKLLDNCIYGRYKFLYLSPERLQQEIVQERIKNMQVNLIAVDEAHCISQWGHDFRPAYRNISVLREIKPKVPFIGLTATATEKVVQDIAEQLKMKDPAILISSFKRENLVFVVKKVQEKNRHLVQLLQEQEGSAIIYVRSRKATLNISGFLQESGISSEPFHGGLSKKEKTERLQDWLNDKKRVMVATSAFGMGIDKPNVRTVVHMNLPESLESYFQEAGRAGRDGKLAKSIILTGRNDVSLLEKQFLDTLPSVEFIKIVYRKLVNYFGIAFGEGENTEHHFNFNDFCSHYNLKIVQTYNALLLLDRASIINLSEQFQKKTRIQFKVSGRQISYYLEENPQFEAVVKVILRTYGGVFDHKVEIKPQVISDKAGTHPSEVIKLLHQLHQRGVAEFEHDQHDTRITFLVAREDDVTVNPLIPNIKLQLSTKKKKIDDVLEYVSNDKKCKSEQLLQYFGEIATEPCGVCSVCNPSEETLSRKEMKKIYFEIVALLEERDHSFREMRDKLNYSENHILQILRILVDKEALIYTSAQKYKLKHL